jgi:hypothetical protein
MIIMVGALSLVEWILGSQEIAMGKHAIFQ